MSERVSTSLSDKCDALVLTPTLDGLGDHLLVEITKSAKQQQKHVVEREGCFVHGQQVTGRRKEASASVLIRRRDACCFRLSSFQ